MVVQEKTQQSNVEIQFHPDINSSIVDATLVVRLQHLEEKRGYRMGEANG
jgi:hypothetical protein